MLRAARALFRFAYEFGDDWRIAVGVLIVLAAGWMAVAADVGADAVLAPLIAVS